MRSKNKDFLHQIKKILSNFLRVFFHRITKERRIFTTTIARLRKQKVNKGIISHLSDFDLKQMPHFAEPILVMSLQTQGFN